ncbi:glycosyltransferase family 2 protein [Myxococcota bacterium]|nr:glycosyltransferase family 2 protein [Myxococcota bacterium]
MRARAVLIIPAFNESASIERVLEGITEAQTGCEIVVIDDGSSDGTSEKAVAKGAKVIRHPFNLGYGAALQTGYKYALSRGASFLVQMDADGQHDPGEVEKLLAPIEAGEFDLIVGSRFLEATEYKMEPIRNVGRWLFRSLVRLAGLKVSDPTSGFQAMNLRALEDYADDFFPTDYPDVDVLLTAYRHGLRVGERSVHMLKANRESTLHGGVRSIYYVYKMLLSTLSASAEKRKP